MDVLNSLMMSLLTPMVLAFILGVIASLMKSDLKIPPEIYTAMTIYLLFAIGLKGGANLDGVTFAEFWRPLTAAIFLSLAIPVWCYFLMKKFGRLDAVNSAALAAHYGSVSAVTFGEALAFLQFAKVPYEPYVAALLAEQPHDDLELPDRRGLEEPGVRIAVRRAPPAIVVSDEGLIPEDYQVPRPAWINYQAIRDALTGGAAVPGAALAEPEPYLSVRTG